MANGLPELNTNYFDASKPLMAAAAIKNTQTQNMLAQRAIQKEVNLSNALRSFAQTGDIAPVIQADPEYALKLQGETEKRQIAKQKLVDEQTAKEVSRGAQLLAPVIDEPDDSKAAAIYQQARLQFYTEHPTSKLKIPEAFDRGTASLMFRQAIPVLEQWKLQNEKPTVGPILYGDDGTRQSSIITRKGGVTPIGGKAPLNTGSMNMQSVVQDPESPTGWSKVDMKGNKISGAAPPMSISRTAQPLTKEDEALAQMIAGGTMAPSQMAKRTGNYNAVLARAKDLNPDLDIRMADMDYNTGKTASFRKQDIAIEAMPEVLKKTVEAGKKLNYSNVKFIGTVEAWKKGQLNDPDFVKYMALRNDALLSIASVMRGTGATDQAHRVEMEAASPTMPPAALDAWLEAQQESLAPRIEQYKKIYGRGKKVEGRKEVRRGKGKTSGRTVILYDDGSQEYAD